MLMFTDMSLLVQLMKVTMLAESSIFSPGSLRYSDVYRRESGRRHTLPFFITIFIISPFQSSFYIKITRQKIQILYIKVFISCTSRLTKVLGDKKGSKGEWGCWYPANTLVSLFLQLIKATVLAESSFYLFTRFSTVMSQVGIALFLCF